MEEIPQQLNFCGVKIGLPGSVRRPFSIMPKTGHNRLRRCELIYYNEFVTDYSLRKHKNCWTGPICCYIAGVGKWLESFGYIRRSPLDACCENNSLMTQEPNIPAILCF